VWRKGFPGNWSSRDCRHARVPRDGEPAKLTETEADGHLRRACGRAVIRERGPARLFQAQSGQVALWLRPVYRPKRHARRWVGRVCSGVAKMSLATLEALFGRVTSIFLVPLINIIFLSLIAHFISGGINFSGNQIQGISSYVIDIASNFSKGDVSFSMDTISDFVKKNGHSIANASTFFLTAVWVTFVVFVYLIDRLTFHIGYFVPPALQFDLDEYGVLNKNAPRLRRFRSLIGEDVPFVIAYAGITAYLGDKNVDKYRLAARSKVTRAIDRAKAALSYTKAYLLFCLLLLLTFIIHGRHLSGFGSCSIIVMLFLSFMLSCLSYANFSKQLVDYDIDSFISDRSYNSSQPVKFSDFSTGETHPDVNFAKTRIGAFLRRTCIRFAMLEKPSA
jgi:hypothetical protein